MNPVSQEYVLRLARHFMESRILLTGAELNLFTLLSDSSLSAGEIAVRTGSDVSALTVLLDALAAMGLLDKQGETYRCESEACRHLSEKTPDSVLAMVLHGAHLWRRWSGLTDVVRGGRPSGKSARSSRNAEEMKAFIGAMHAVAAPLADRIVATVKPGDARALIDVGGASGTYTIAFLRAVPGMKATLFDRVGVMEMARERMEKEGMLDRVRLVGGDFYRDELPKGHDLALLSAIIHQNSAGQNLSLFQKVFHSLNAGGRIIIRDYVMEPDRTHPRGGAVFAVNMLVNTSGGGTYTFEEIRSGLSQAGFGRIRLLEKGEHMDALVEAFRP
ncbi:MAG TPA: methyltransferase [Syntrophales bacterium]|jgi:predicted O-methyltransferase YrrM|nr:methyltransferase [Syntrophales bacterium]HRT62626.1 methyltransferase [Syntrophales bacterium]